MERLMTFLGAFACHIPCHSHRHTDHPTREIPSDQPILPPGCAPVSPCVTHLWLPLGLSKPSRRFVGGSFAIWTLNDP